MAIIHIFRIVIEGPEIHTYDGGPNQMAHIMSKNFDEANQRMVDDLRQPDAVSNIEDVINDELPDGYYCKIVE